MLLNDALSNYLHYLTISHGSDDIPKRGDFLKKKCHLGMTGHRQEIMDGRQISLDGRLVLPYT